MVEAWVKDLVDEVFGGKDVKVGDVIRHTPSGRQVKIVGGQRWGTHGFSNHWQWCEVLADGSLGPIEHGYGWW